MKTLALSLSFLLLASCSSDWSGFKANLIIAVIDVYDGRIIFNEKVYRSESGLFELHFHRSKVFPGIAAIQANGTKLYNGVFLKRLISRLLTLSK